MREWCFESSIIYKNSSLETPRPPELFESKTQDDNSVDNDVTVLKGRQNSSLELPKQENVTFFVLR